jgi:hypothetical protein
MNMAEKISGQIDTVMARVHQLDRRLEAERAEAVERAQRERRYSSAAADVDYLVRKDSLHRLQQQEADRIAEAREQDRHHAESRQRIQTRYDDAFASFGEHTPPPVADEYPGDYRRRLLQRLINKLPAGSDWATSRADDFDSAAIKPIEAQVLAAAKVEGDWPSRQNLPRDGSMVKRERVDRATGARTTTWHGRTSFIKALTRPCAR